MFKHDEAVAMVSSLKAENQIYSDSPDPMLAKVGRVNNTILGVLLTFLNAADPENYNSIVDKIGSDRKSLAKLSPSKKR